MRSISAEEQNIGGDDDDGGGSGGGGGGGGGGGERTDRNRRSRYRDRAEQTKTGRKGGKFQQTDMLNMLYEEEYDIFQRIGHRVLVNVASHPLEYAKILMQIGYEPIPPQPTRTFFGNPALKLANVFQYVKYIYTIDGFYGCYRGLVPKLCANLVNVVTCEMAANCTIPLIIKEKDTNAETWERNKTSQECKRTVLNLIVDLVNRTVAILVSHPLDVITIRMMAQFVGRETKYSGIFSSISEIYTQNGIMGFYAGLTPRVLGTAATLVIAATSTYAINRFLINEPAPMYLTASTTRFMATTITYPFTVVSYSMAVNDSGLAAGCPPQMPIYDSWIDCWHHLKSNNQLKRGSSLLWRYYVGPQLILYDRKVPIM